MPKSNDSNQLDREDTMPEQNAETNLEQTEQTTEGSVSDATPGTGQDSENPNREAAKYRRQLRDVEAERDTLTSQVEAMRRAMIEGEVQRAGYKPAAFWSRDENTADKFFGDDGTLNTDQLTEAIQATARELGLTSGRGPVAPKEGGTSRPRASKTWDSAFQAQNG